MKIAKVDAIPVRAELGNMAEFWAEDMWGRDERGASWLRPENEWRKRPIYSKYIETMLVRVLTDDGLIGYGECHMPITPQIGKAIIDDLLAPIIIDQNPMATEYIWEQLYASMRLRGYDSGFFMEAIAGIDIALWDIKGKALGVPIYTLLGGPITTSLRAYHSHLPAASPKYLAELAQRIISQGYTAIELGGGTGVAGDVRAVAAVREVVGPDVQIMMDCGGAYNLSSALSLAKELEKLNLWFLEDPLPHEDYDGYAELGKRLNFAIATGESKCTRYHFRDLLKSGGVDIVLPDIGRSGGITETLKIAHLADAYS